MKQLLQKILYALIKIYGKETGLKLFDKLLDKLT